MSAPAEPAKPRDPGKLPDMVLLPDQSFTQLQGLLSGGNLNQYYQGNPYWQGNLGMTTQVLPGVAGAQSFNAQQLTQTVPDIYMSTHRQ